VSGAVYNIGSGISRSIHSILDTLLSMAATDIQVEPDPERMRPSDVPSIMCDNARFVERTGWKPTIPWPQSLADTLEDWRERVQAAAPSNKEQS